MARGAQVGGFRIAFPDALLSFDSRIDSSKWTGIEARLNADPVLHQRIHTHILELDALIDQTELTNLERQKAKAITDALIKLIASPDPEWRVIVALLISSPLQAALNLATMVDIIIRVMAS